jgi:hypothetical protein
MRIVGPKYGIIAVLSIAGLFFIVRVIRYLSTVNPAPIMIGLCLIIGFTKLYTTSRDGND